jgi:DNA repair exonuclease SbcCD nuclease subunit
VRLLYSTDGHFKKTSPQSRLDDYPSAILKKYQWVTDFGNEQKVDLFVDGGDLFDSAIQNPWEIMQVAKTFEGRCAPTKGVAGNHPIRGDAVTWMGYSGLYLLERLFPKGYFTILDPFKADIEFGGRKFRLHHTDLVRKPVLWNHTLWEDYETDADVVLVSHYHPQQGVEVVNGHLFVSPGAISRGSLGEDNTSRIPAVALIDVDSRGKVKVKLIDIPCEPGEKVLNTSTVLKVVDVERDLTQYEESVAALRTARDNPEKTISPEEILRTLGASLALGSDTIDLALETLKTLKE